MIKKSLIFIFAIVAVAVLVPGVSRAASVADLQAQILKLMEQVRSLQAKLQAVNSSATSMVVDSWTYVRSDPFKKHCASYDHQFCWSQLDAGLNRLVSGRSDTGIGVFVRDPLKAYIGVSKDGWSVNGDQGSRCFSDTQGNCILASYPPFYMPTTASLPVLPAASISPQRVTLAGKDLFSFKTFYVNQTDPNSCAVSPQAQGSINHSEKLFLVDSVDFGGNIGVRRNVLVLEEVAGYPAGATDPWRGQRLERYWLIQGYGVVREDGYEDTDCRANPTLTTCDGVYDVAGPGSTTWSQEATTAVPVYEYCAPGATGAQIVSRSVPISMIAGNSYQVSVTVKNTGFSVWKASAGYKLGADLPLDNTTWGTSRVALTDADAIKPGQTKTFSFSVTAPATKGQYKFAWRMVQENVGWFGDTLSAPVNVASPTLPPATSTIVGYFDGINLRNGLIEGWALDVAQQNRAIAVAIYADGAYATGKFLGEVTANYPRPDINSATGYVGNHAFNLPVPAWLRDGMDHKIYVYAVTNGSARLKNPVLIWPSPLPFALK